LVKFKGSKVQRFKGSKVQGFKSSKVQRFKKLRSSRVQKLRGWKLNQLMPMQPPNPLKGELQTNRGKRLKFKVKRLKC